MTERNDDGVHVVQEEHRCGGYVVHDRAAHARRHVVEFADGPDDAEEDARARGHGQEHPARQALFRLLWVEERQQTQRAHREAAEGERDPRDVVARDRHERVAEHGQEPVALALDDDVEQVAACAHTDNASAQICERAGDQAHAAASTDLRARRRPKVHTAARKVSDKRTHVEVSAMNMPVVVVSASEAALSPFCRRPVRRGDIVGGSALGPADISPTATRQSRAHTHRSWVGEVAAPALLFAVFDVAADDRVHKGTASFSVRVHTHRRAPGATKSLQSWARADRSVTSTR